MFVGDGVGVRVTVGDGEVVGRGLAVGVDVGFDVGRGLAVGATVDVEVGVGDGLGVVVGRGELVGDAEGVGVGDGVTLLKPGPGDSEGRGVTFVNDKVIHNLQGSFAFDGDDDGDGFGVGVGVTTGVGEGVGVVEGVGVGVGTTVVEGVGVGVTTGVGEGVGVTTGVGEGVGVGVAAGVAVFAPGHVCDSRIPELVVFVAAKVPLWTIRSCADVGVYTYAPLPNCTHAPLVITYLDPSVLWKRILSSIERFGSFGSWKKVAPRVVRTKCHAS